MTAAHAIAAWFALSFVVAPLLGMWLRHRAADVPAVERDWLGES